MADIRITREELSDMLASAVSAGVAAALAAVPPAAPPVTSIPFNPDEQMRKQVGAVRGTDIEPPPVETMARRVHARTGLSFIPVFFRGKCVRLEEEADPPGVDVHKKEGGLVPDGLPIRNISGTPTPQYKQWKWSTIRRPTFQDLIGEDRDWMLRMTSAVDVPVAAE